MQPLRMPKLDRRRNRGTEIQATGIQAMQIQIRAMGTRVMRIQVRVTRIRAMGVRSTMIPDHLRRARMVTTLITLTHARPTATMDPAGSPAESLLASGLGGVGVGATSLGALALAGGATMEAVAPLPGAEDIAEGSVTVTPAEADVPLMAVDVPSVAADVASVEADVPCVAADVASEALDMPSVVVDMATGEAEAEAVMAVGAGSFHRELETVAADGICCRPSCS